VGQFLSERAQHFVQTWERQPYVENLALVRAAIEEAGLPVTEPVLDFHHTFAGYLTDVWGERGPLGIIHPKIVAIESWSEPMKIGGYLRGKKPLLACADIHMSWEMMIGLDGTFYCNGPESSSYFMWTEQAAFMWEFSRMHRWRRLRMPLNAKKVTTVLAARVASFRINALCDDYGQAYGTDRFAVIIGREGERCDVLVIEDELPVDLEGLETP
jgi:hypothetical protein